MPNVITAPATQGIRFSGHETFACRHAWLPKAYRALVRDPATFLNEDAAIADLGLGKNMIRSLRFWVEACGMASGAKGVLRLTSFADAIFGEGGQDPYLENVRTLWLLHWQLASRSEGVLFAWRQLMSHWPLPEFTRSEVLRAFARESSSMGHAHSAVTLGQHLDVFLQTYGPRRSGLGIEDSLDGPLVGLRLVEAVGQRQQPEGRSETVFAFRRGPKPDVTAALFEWCLSDFWLRFRPNEETLSLREVAHAPCSPGQVFKLTEDDVRIRLESYAERSREKCFQYRPSAVQGMLSRRRGAYAPSLADVYERDD